MGETLKDLALAAVNDPNNPAYDPTAAPIPPPPQAVSQPAAPVGTAQQADGSKPGQKTYAQIHAEQIAADEKLASQPPVVDDAIKIARLDDAYNAGTITKSTYDNAKASLQPGGNPNLAPAAVAPAAIAPEPKKDKKKGVVPGAVAVGGGVAKPVSSPGLDYLKARGEITDDEIAALASKGKTADDIEDIYYGKRAPSTMPGVEGKRGGVVQRVEELETLRQLNDQAQAAKEASYMQHANADAEQRTSQRLSEAAELRGAEPDPRKWFKDRGVFGTIAAAIAMGAGAFAAIRGHGTNYAMDIIQKGIDQNIDAQKEGIANKWKALNFKGSEDDKKYAKDMFTLNKMHEQGLTDWSHAGAMIDMEIAKGGTAERIAKLNDMKADVRLEQDERKSNLALLRMQVIKEEEARRAAAASAAAGRPGGAAWLDKKYYEDVEARQKHNIEHPDKPVPILSRAEYAKQFGGQGGPAPAGGASTASDVFESGLSDLEKGARVAMQSSGIGTSVAGAVTPGGTLENDRRGILKAKFGGMLKGVESKTTQDQIDAHWAAVDPTAPGLSDAQREQRLQGMLGILHDAAKAAQGKKAMETGSE